MQVLALDRPPRLVSVVTKLGSTLSRHLNYRKIYSDILIENIFCANKGVLSFFCFQTVDPLEFKAVI